MASSLEGAGLIPGLSMIIPRNSCLADQKTHLAKCTDRPAASSRRSTFIIEIRWSSHVTLAVRMSSSQLVTSSFGSLRSFCTTRGNTDGRTVRPYPTLLNLYSCPSGSRKAVLCLCLSAIST